LDAIRARGHDVANELNNPDVLLDWCDVEGIPSEAVYRSLAETLGIDFIELAADETADPDFIAKVPIQIARRFNFVGLAADDTSSVEIVCGSLDGCIQSDNIGRLLGRSVVCKIADPAVVQRLVDSAYQRRSSQTAASIQSLESDDSTIEIRKQDDLLDESGRSSVVKVVNSILFDAVQQRASDIHIQPYESHLQVRFRIDGILFDQFEIPHGSQEEVISRIKVISQMDIAEKRLPQDGRATIRVGTRRIDLRVASLPTSFGERVVIRLLDKSARLYTLAELGMDREILQQFQRLVHLEHGLILVTGPTGGGKSTTLYAALQEINAKDRNIVTLEDPIEYQLPGISQTQVNEKKGMTFARGLRNVLRQDPDIIMIGEIRDQETAEMAIQSALTGHMVFSTLHTNDAPSAVTRLLDLGIEPYLVSSSVVAVLAQRLVRQICDQCKQLSTDTSLLTKQSETSLNDSRHFEGRGCTACRQTGYQGRKGIFELMAINQTIQRSIQTGSDAANLRGYAVANGMKSLREDGLRKIHEGQTTVSEVARVTMDQVIE